MDLKKRLHYIRYGSTYKSFEKFSTVILSGSDVVSFLQNQITINVNDLVDGKFKKAAILNNKGQLVSCFYLLKASSKKFLVLVNSNYLEITLERLDQFLISEDVEISKSAQKFYAILGIIPTEFKGYAGRLFNESCLFVDQRPEKLEQIQDSDFGLLQLVSGEPKMGVEVFPNELFTNTYLVECALSQRKGCYPGQETVSKILNNRGAAKFPVCLISDKETPNEIKIDNKKIGTILKSIQVEGAFLHYALVSREFRVDKMKFSCGGINFEVHYFPLFKNSITDKVEDLYFHAIQEFQLGHEEVAVKMLRLCIELDPTYEDAYESLGVLYGRLGDNHKAIELMHKLAKLNPKSVMAHTNLSLYYMKIGEIKLAEDHKAEATVKQFEVLGEEAKLKRDKEQKELAQKEEEIRKEGMFKQVLEIDPEDALANLGLGEISLNRNEYLEAEKYLEKAINTDPNYSVAYLALAKTLKESGKLDKLKEVLAKGIAVSTKNGDMMPANEMQSILNSL